MISFKEYILEYLDFQYGKDVDFVLSDDIIFVSKGSRDSYKLEGKTHGEYSHAIKHYIEFNPALFLQFGAEIKGIIQKAYESGNLDYIELYNENGDIVKGYNQVMAAAKPMDYLNMLDYINDKNVNKEKFIPLEIEIKKVGDKIRKLYDEEIKKRIDNSINIDKSSLEEIKSYINQNKILKFSDNKNNQYVLDLKDNIIIIINDENVTTCYKFNKKASGFGVINNFNKKIFVNKFKNINVKKAFS